ncbi:hypothetical protein [Streptomyces sp. GC420]|uniref:SCO2195 family GlnR-regulated protein n=1 Tax=Streptomyces sp. GC420 TaxID=2697568 RepID=UPI001415015D|nr:hypothetical protein [Streptomyces sp. GC420]NBM17572.1 hypothetical protein [Streptomyces sp. GC420]
MQPAPSAHATATPTALPSAIPAPLPSLTGALRVVESLLMNAGQATARRNAWTAVLEDRRRAKDRHEVEHALEAVATRSTSAT